MRKQILPFLAAAAALLPMRAGAQAADVIIDRAVAAYARLNSMRAEFRQTLTNPLTGSTQTTNGVILRKTANILANCFSDKAITAPPAPEGRHLP